jgi:hypothetical protein
MAMKVALRTLLFDVRHFTARGDFTIATNNAAARQRGEA